MKAAAWLWDPSRRTRTLLLYGVLAAIVAGFYLWAKLPDAEVFPIQGHRVADMNASINLMEAEGAPPLLKPTPQETLDVVDLPLPSYDSILNGGDDTGLYVYVSLIGDALNLEAREALRVLLLIFLLPALYFPLLFYRLTGSALAAIAAPILLIGAVIGHMMYLDVYWAMAWAAMALIPLIVYAWLQPSRWSLAILAAVMAAAGFASTVRGGAGLGIAIAAIVTVLFAFKIWSWPLRAGAAVLLVAAYAAFSPGLMSLYENRAVDWAGENLYEEQANSDGWFFHIAFIGLGYQPNEWDIYYRDQIANAWAKREDGELIYLSDEYDAVLQELFFDRVGENPKFFVTQLGEKVAVSFVNAGVSTLLFVLIGGTFIAIAAPRPSRRLMRLAAALAVPALLLGLAPGLLAIPQPQLVLGSTGVLAILEVLIWTILLAAAGAHLAPRARELLAAGRRPSAREAAPFAGLALVGVLLIVAPGAARAAAIIVFAAIAVLSLLSRTGLRRFAPVARAGASIGTVAAVAALLLIAIALPVREVAQDASDDALIWDSDLAKIDQTVADILPVDQQVVPLPPAN